MKPQGKGHGWALGIVAGFVIFVGAIMVLVIMSMARDVDLVTDQYYEKELRYQERIRALERASDPGAAIVIEERGDTLLLRFPPTIDARQLAGTVTLYRASNSKEDRVIALRPDAFRQQGISTAGLMPGFWRMKMEWRVDGVEYYSEKVIMLN